MGDIAAPTEKSFETEIYCCVQKCWGKAIRFCKDRRAHDPEEDARDLLVDGYEYFVGFCKTPAEHRIKITGQSCEVIGKEDVPISPNEIQAVQYKCQHIAARNDRKAPTTVKVPGAADPNDINRQVRGLVVDPETCREDGLRFRLTEVDKHKIIIDGEDHADNSTSIRVIPLNRYVRNKLEWLANDKHLKKTEASYEASTISFSEGDRSTANLKDCDQIVDSAKKFIDRGFRKGMKITVRNAQTSPNNRDYRLAEVTEDRLFLSPGDKVTNEIASSPVTIKGILHTAVTNSETVYIEEPVEVSEGNIPTAQEIAHQKTFKEIQQKIIDESSGIISQEDLRMAKDFLDSGKINSALREAHNLHTEGISYEEIAKLQGVSPTTARTRVCRVRKLLAKEFPGIIKALKAGQKKHRDSETDQ